MHAHDVVKVKLRQSKTNVINDKNGQTNGKDRTQLMKYVVTIHHIRTNVFISYKTEKDKTQKCQGLYQWERAVLLGSKVSPKWYSYNGHFIMGRLLHWFLALHGNGATSRLYYSI